MRINWSKYLTLAGFFFCCGISIAQKKDSKADLLKMNETYSRANSYSMNIAVRVFEGKSASTEPTAYSGIVKKSNDGYFSSMKGISVIVNDHCSILVDDNQKMIVYGTSAGKNPKQKDPGTQFSPVLDTALFNKNQIELKSYGNGQETFKVLTPGNEFFEKMEVTLDISSYTLSEIIYYYKSSEDISGSKVIVNYSDVKLNKAMSASVFSERAYIEKKGDKLHGIGKYVGYKLLDNTKAAEKKRH